MSKRKPPRTFQRNAHGTARDHGRRTVTETRPWDEQSKAAQAAPPIQRKPNGQLASSDDARRLAKLPRAPRTLVPKEARPYRKRRVGELERAWGALSIEVLQFVDAAACAWLAGKKASHRAAETGNAADIKAMVQAFELAKSLSKDAWDLATLEHEAHEAKHPRDPTSEIREAAARRAASMNGGAS